MLSLPKLCFFFQTDDTQIIIYLNIIINIIISYSSSSSVGIVKFLKNVFIFNLYHTFFQLLSHLY